jgi:hypothetical protein
MLNLKKMQPEKSSIGVDKNTEKRYYDYILIYANTILELSEELEKKCKKSR